MEDGQVQPSRQVDDAIANVRTQRRKRMARRVVFSMMPAAAGPITDDIRALVAKRMRDKGDMSGVLDETVLTAAVRERLSGDPIEWNGVKILPPSFSREWQSGDKTAPSGDAWDRSRWRDYLRSIKPSDYGLGQKPDGKVMLPILPSVKREIAPDVIYDRGVLRNVGDGQYTVQIDGEFLVNPRTGQKFVQDHRNVGAASIYDRDSQRKNPR